MTPENKVNAWLNRNRLVVEKEEEKESPVQAYLRGIRPSSLAQRHEGGAERFAEGVGRGFIYPVRSIVSDVTEGSKTAAGKVLHDIANPDPTAGIAGMAGELVGMGLSFVPFWRGATTVTGGIGLLKSAPKLQQVINASTSFAGYEALAGETVGEAPERMARGLVEGALFEVGLLGVAAGWRRRFGRVADDGFKKEAQQLETLASEVAVHPDALKIERWFSPADETLDVTVEKLRAVADPQANLYQALARITKTHMPGGQVLLPDMGDLEGIRAIADELNLKYAVHLDARGAGGGKAPKWNVLLVDQEKALLKIKDPELKKVFLGEGDPVLSYKQFIQLVEEHGDLTVWDNPNFKRALGQYFLIGHSELPSFPKPNLRGIQLDGTHYKKYQTLIHEYWHYLHDTNPVTGGDDMKIYYASFERLFEVDSSVANLMRQELKGVTEEVRTRLRTGEGMPKGKARKEAQAEIAGKQGYYYTDRELSARLTELMFADPKEARRLAPASTEIMAQYITKHAPRMYEVMSKQAQAVQDIFNELWIKRQGKATIWTEGKPKLTDRDLRQFGQQGFFEGMSVFVDGKQAAFMKMTGDRATIRFGADGEKVDVPLNKVFRATVPQVLRFENEVVKAVDEMLGERIKWVGLNLREFGKEDPTQDFMRRAMVELEEFEFVDGPQGYRKWLKELAPEELQRFDTQDVLQGGPENPGGKFAPASRFTVGEAMHLYNVMKQRGKKGFAYWDGVNLDLVVAESSAIKLGDEAGLKFAKAWGGSENIMGTADEVISFRIDFDDTYRAMLREKGVQESDIPFFLDLTKERLGKKFYNLLDERTKQMVTDVEKLVTQVDDSLEGLASRAGFERSLTNDGRIEIRDIETKSVVGRFADEEEATDFIVQSGAADGPPIVSFPGGKSAGGGSTPPPFQGQIPQGPDDIPLRPESSGMVGRFFTSARDGSFLLGASITALENFAKTAERRGLGPVYNRIFLPGQQAILRVEREMAEVKRELLGGVSFMEGMQKLEGITRKIHKSRQQTITEYVEFLSKEEVAKAGGFMQRDMTPNEIRVADFIEKAGLQNDIPRLMTTKRLMESAVKGQARLEGTIEKMKMMQLTPEAQELLMVFESMPRFKNQEDIVKFLGLSADEQQVLKIIDDSTQADKDNFSIAAVSRYASAPRLEKGFKTGREMYAVQHKMTADEMKAADQIDKLLATAFGISGMDAKRQIGGYWPHMRMWAKEGWDPKLMGRHAGLPLDFVEWSHDRFRTGELDIYNMDPLVTTYKYIRGLVMKQEFDPVLPDMVKALKTTRDIDQRTFRLMDAYITELQGKPHESFGKLQQAIEAGTRAWVGKELPRGFTQNVVNTLAGLAAAATIPFRPALIIRNYFESAQKIAPRVGIDYYIKAAHYVTAKETGKEARDAARRAFAITPGQHRLKSIHAAEEIFGPGGSKLNYQLERMLDKGFGWYQSADDWGRAIAFHAQKFRMQDEFGKYMKGRQSYDEFIENAKLLTFDPLDLQNIEKKIKAGAFDEASDYAGWILSRETMNRYGMANHPSGWNSVAGRLLGQFGTWPVQYKDFLSQGLTRGTTRDRVEFAATHFGIMGGTITGGAMVGLNLESWIGFPSLFYTGGPFADLSIDVVRSISGSETEKALARRNLIAQVPILGWMETGSPRSMFLPGSYLLGDLWDASQADGLFDATLEGTGFRLMRPDEKTSLEWLTGI